MNGHQKLYVYDQKKQNFIQHLSQIVKVINESDMGHPDTRDAIAWLRKVLEYNAIAGNNVGTHNTPGPGRTQKAGC